MTITKADMKENVRNIHARPEIGESNMMVAKTMNNVSPALPVRYGGEVPDPTVDFL